MCRIQLRLVMFNTDARELDNHAFEIARRTTPATIYIRAKADVNAEVSTSSSNSNIHIATSSAGLEVIGLLSSGSTSTLAESLPAPTAKSPCNVFPDKYKASGPYTNGKAASTSDDI